MRRVALLLIVLAVSHAIFLSGSRAESLAPLPCAQSPRPEDEIWLVSTRHMGEAACTDSDVDQAAIYQRVSDGSWEPRELATLLADSSRLPTIVYVHGNRTESDSVYAQGAAYYDLLTATNPRPFRLVLWSWPSHQQLRGLRDLRLKAYRSDSEAWYLAQLLARWDEKAPLSLVGYSYGGRVVTGTLHLLAGGSWNGRPLTPPPPAEGRPIRAALIAPAVHYDWIAPQAQLGRAIEITDALLIFFNPCDPALKRYHFVFRCERPLALGAVGIAPETFGDAAERVRVVNVSAQVGRTHDEAAYVAAPITATELPALLLGPAASSP